MAVDAAGGPQVSLDGVPLVGRLPSEREPWIDATVPTLEDPDLPEYVDGLRFGARREPCLLGLGLVLRGRQNGDHVRCRPVFIAPGWAMQGQEWIEDLIPDREWWGALSVEAGPHTVTPSRRRAGLAQSSLSIPKSTLS
ncbi:hypothetical protein SF23_04020 [Streptomyces sp. MBRL 10]|nr:hypothetical protein SF23_04020 [Streptomyces sp. MBRL 10]